MRNAPRHLVLLIGAAALAACQSDESDQNITIGDNAAANAEIEALPADESSATPSGDLVNGAVEENAPAEENLTNGY